MGHADGGRTLPCSGESKSGQDPGFDREFEAGVVLSGVLAFATIGPLRNTFEAIPGVMLAGVLILFLVPGALLARWFLGGYFSGVALLPAAVVISTGASALLGVPMLVFQTRLEVYLLASGAVIAASLLAAALAVLLRTPRPKQASGSLTSDRGGCCGCRFWPSSGL